MPESLECILGMFSFLKFINHYLKKKKEQMNLSSKAVVQV